MEAYAFDDDLEEASWLLADLLRDRAASDLDWGDYALLYRTHRVGQLLETRLIEAGVPCRLAKGQALRDDEVIGYVAAALRVIRAPDDPLAVEALAELLLPGHLLEQLRVRYHDLDLLSGLRTYARAAPGEADSKKAWRFIYQIGNLEALRRTHDTLRPLVEELLSQRIGPYRNPLEERGAELSDPKDFPGAWPMATRLYETVARGGMIWVEPDRGLEIPFLRMLKAALGDYVQRLAPESHPARGDFVFRAGSVRPLALFKSLQLHHCRGLADPVPGLRRLRPRDHRHGRRRVRHRRDRGGTGARAGDRRAVRAAGPARSPGQRQGERGARLLRSRPLRSARFRRDLAGVSASSSDPTCWWRTTGADSTCRCCCVSPPGCRAPTI